ncbi:MAG: hypothetical protein RLN62_06415 [Rickettsiales bacterium]
MDGKVLAYLEKLKVTFFASPTKGLVYYENLLLPKDDKGQNDQGHQNLRDAFKDASSKQKDLIEETIEMLKFLRKQAIEDSEAKKIIEQFSADIRDQVAMNRVIAENSRD